MQSPDREVKPFIINTVNISRSNLLFCCVPDDSNYLMCVINTRAGIADKRVFARNTETAKVNLAYENCIKSCYLQFQLL